METVKGIIENVVYRNDSNDYTVIEISNEDDGLITAVGIMPMAFEGENVILSGAWTFHKEFGKQFAFESYENLTNVVLGESVTYIGNFAFYDCPNISNVFYMGTNSNYQNINIQAGNESIHKSTKYYYSETEPIEEGNYWHYVDGVITIW